MMTVRSAPALARTVLDDGAEFHHQEAGAGRPLVFVHGGMGDWSSWEPQWEAFTPSFRCITYSRRFSSPNRNPMAFADHSVRREARDLAALLRAWRARPAILVGTSYGAYTALQLALTDPGSVSALALTEPPVLPFADRAPGGRAARLAFEREVLAPADQAFRAGRALEAVELLTTGINGPGPGEALSPAGRARRLRNAEAMRALALSNDPYPALDEVALARLRTPTLLMSGEHTLPVHRAITAALAQLMPAAQLVRVPGCGHGVHRDNPQAFNERVLRFLREIPLRPA